MILTFDCCSAFAGKVPSGPSFLLTNPFHVREFREFRRRRLKHHRHAHHRTAFTVRSQSNPFESLFHNLVSQVTTVNSLELIAPALGFSSGVALYLSNVVSAKNFVVSDIGEWILLSSPTPFNRFVFLRCPSIAFPGSYTNVAEDVSEKLVKEDRHFVRLHSGRIKVTTGDDALEDKLTYQRLCISTEDGGVISLDWPSNLNLREEHGLDTTLFLVPGTPEGSMDRNVRLSVIEALGRGLFPIVMNPRGCAGSPLTTARCTMEKHVAGIEEAKEDHACCGNYVTALLQHWLKKKSREDDCSMWWRCGNIAVALTSWQFSQNGAHPLG